MTPLILSESDLRDRVPLDLAAIDVVDDRQATMDEGDRGTISATVCIAAGTVRSPVCNPPVNEINPRILDGCTAEAYDGAKAAHGRKPTTMLPRAGRRNADTGRRKESG